MSITDIMKDIAKKDQSRNMVGDPIVHGIMIGVVKENNNNKFPGMVRVQVPTRDANNNILQWMKVCVSYVGKAWGTYVLPEIGDQVMVAFANGNLHNAYVIASVPKNDSDFVSGCYTDENYKKEFKTKGKNKLSFYDEEDKQKVEISTPSGQLISIDNEKKLTSITDKDGKNKIEINTEEGFINLESENKLVIKVGGVELSISEEGKTVSVSCDKFNIKAGQSINIDSQNIKIESATFDVSASTSVKIKSDGVSNLAGQTVKLG